MKKVLSHVMLVLANVTKESSNERERERERERRIIECDKKYHYI